MDHGVSAEFIQQVRALGFPDLTLEQAVNLVDHGVTADFIEKWKAKTGSKLVLSDDLYQITGCRDRPGLMRGSTRPESPLNITFYEENNSYWHGHACYDDYALAGASAQDDNADDNFPDNPGLWSALVVGDQVHIQFGGHHWSSGASFALSETGPLPTDKQGAFTVKRDAGTVTSTASLTASAVMAPTPLKKTRPSNPIWHRKASRRSRNR